MKYDFEYLLNAGQESPALLPSNITVPDDALVMVAVCANTAGVSILADGGGLSENEIDAGPRQAVFAFRNCEKNVIVERRELSAKRSQRFFRLRLDTPSLTGVARSLRLRADAPVRVWGQVHVM